MNEGNLGSRSLSTIILFGIAVWNIVLTFVSGLTC